MVRPFESTIKAVEVAKLNGAITIGFLGFDGGKVKELLVYKIGLKVRLK